MSDRYLRIPAEDWSRCKDRQIIHNVTGFFGVLAEWSRAERLAAANDAAAPAKPNDGGVRHDR
jgi:hypothetical protein